MGKNELLQTKDELFKRSSWQYRLEVRMRSLVETVFNCPDL